MFVRIVLFGNCKTFLLSLILWPVFASPVVLSCLDLVAAVMHYNKRFPRSIGYYDGNSIWGQKQIIFRGSMNQESANRHCSEIWYLENPLYRNVWAMVILNHWLETGWYGISS